MIQTSGILSQKSSLTGVRKEIPHLWQNTLEDEDEEHFQVMVGFNSLPLAQFQKFFPKEILTLFGMGASFVHFFF